MSGNNKHELKLIASIVLDLKPTLKKKDKRTLFQKKKIHTHTHMYIANPLFSIVKIKIRNTKSSKLCDY